MPTPIALVDCNNFYASCERLFQPELRNKPVVVLSNNDGCVIARSNEAKALGIEMAAPWHLYRGKFEKQGVVVRSSNYALYGDVSARVMKTLAGFTTDLEIYSIDEAFLGLAGFETRLESHARDLRETVLKWTGIPVSVGIAPTKTLAKVANRFAKKDARHEGVFIMSDDDVILRVLGSIALRDLWGVAGRTESRLNELGITTPRQLRDADPQFIRERFSVVMQRMVMELRGVPCIALEDVSPDRKSVMASRSFGRPVTSYQELSEAISTYTSRAAEKIRRQNLSTAHVSVFVNTDTFKPQDPQYYATQPVRLPVATADTGTLLKAARAALRALYKRGYRYKKAGVVLLELTQVKEGQGDLWEKPDSPKTRRLMRAIDSLNANHGRGTVIYASSGYAKAWRLRSDFVSPRYTTSWNDLLKVGELKGVRRRNSV
jgi:DNA polymerase V